MREREREKRGRITKRWAEEEEGGEREGGGTGAATVDYTLFRRVKRANSRTDERYKS